MRLLRGRRGSSTVLRSARLRRNRRLPHAAIVRGDLRERPRLCRLVSNGGKWGLAVGRRRTFFRTFRARWRRRSQRPARGRRADVSPLPPDSRVALTVPTRPERFMPKLSRPSPALVVATIALFIAAGGGAWAATKSPSSAVYARATNPKASIASRGPRGPRGATGPSDGLVISVPQQQPTERR